MIQKLLGHASIKTTEIYLRSLNIENEINKVIKYSPLQNLDLKKFLKRVDRITY